MKKFHLFVSLVLSAAVLLPVSSVSADNGVDNLRGRWDVEWSFDDPELGSPGPLILYVNDLRASTTYADTYYAAGCMRSPETEVFMPMSVRAVYDGASNSYEAVIYSTVVPPAEQGEPYVARFIGTILINGESVKDDSAGGSYTTEFAAGEWSGSHHDRRNTKCPSVRDAGLGVQGDLYVHRDLGYATPKNRTLYEAHTVIVSSGMLVEAPDGTSFVVQEYTDIFSPDVDFVGRFRYLQQFEGLPAIGGIYTFTLLDIFGEPIPGTDSSDVWFACNQSAPVNLNAVYYFEDSVSLGWDTVPVVPGEFDPGGDPQIGFYQIGVSPFNWPGAGDYGSNGIASPSHVLPWGPFEPGGSGNPDGFDYGVSLSELPDGNYQAALYAFSQPNPQSGGNFLECMTFDSTEFLVMDKQGSDLSFQQVATISGQVFDGSGEPLEGIRVDACEYDWQDGDFCNSDWSDGNGSYMIVVPGGSYRVGVNGQPGWANEFYNDTPDWNLAEEVFALAGGDTAGIDFNLTAAGSISGTVRDADGQPLANIAVDTEMGGYGTCTDENGNYTLQGVPFGTYNVVAGRQFCAEHPYAEKTAYELTITADVPDLYGIDFYLTLP